MNELRERLENTIITRTFHVSGMPIGIWDEINTFCIDNFGDSRWNMVYTLVKAAKEDYKYAMLYDEIEVLKERVALLEQGIPTKGVDVSGNSYKTFGKKE